MKLVILDRDGTINSLAEDEFFITSLAEWVPVPGALEAIARLGHAGWRVVIATNQPGLGRGLLDVTTMNAIHALMHKQLASLGGRIDAVFYCPHTVDENCTCRKPLPGLLEQICERYGLDPSDVPVVGSCAAHLQAGAAIGAPLHLVGSGQAAAPGAHALDTPAIPLPAGTQVHANLAALVDHLLAPKVVVLV